MSFEGDATVKQTEVEQISPDSTTVPIVDTPVRTWRDKYLPKVNVKQTYTSVANKVSKWQWFISLIIILTGLILFFYGTTVATNPEWIYGNQEGKSYDERGYNKRAMHWESMGLVLIALGVYFHKDSKVLA